MLIRFASLSRAAAVLALGLALANCASTAGPVDALALAPPPPLHSERYAAVVVDANSGRMLYEASATAPRRPASLTKMMTLYLVFEALESGRITRSTPIPVSAYAASRPPTKIGFQPGETIDVDSAIKALVTKSANDVAAAIGEYLAGSESAFAERMTAKARQLGMTGTVFRNASGLPDPGQVTTARDMALLGMALRRRFPQYYGYFSTREFGYRGRMVRGHNRLLGSVDGVDGIKTGYTRESGYNLVTSVRSGGRSLVAVVMGGDSAAGRDARMEAMIASYLPRASTGGG